MTDEMKPMPDAGGIRIERPIIKPESLPPIFLILFVVGILLFGLNAYFLLSEMGSSAPAPAVAASTDTSTAASSTEGQLPADSAEPS